MEKVKQQALDLSPSCSSLNYWCAEVNMTILDAQGWPDVIVQGPYGGEYPAEIVGNATANSALASQQPGSSEDEAGLRQVQSMRLGDARRLVQERAEI